MAVDEFYFHVWKEMLESTRTLADTIAAVVFSNSFMIFFQLKNALRFLFPMHFTFYVECFLWTYALGTRIFMFCLLSSRFSS